MDGYGIYSKLAFLGKKKSESIYCKDMCAQSCGKSSGFGGFGVAGFRFGKSLWVCCFWWFLVIWCMPLSQPTNCLKLLCRSMLAELIRQTNELEERRRKRTAEMLRCFDDEIYDEMIKR